MCKYRTSKKKKGKRLEKLKINILHAHRGRGESRGKQSCVRVVEMGKVRKTNIERYEQMEKDTSIERERKSCSPYLWYLYGS